MGEALSSWFWLGVATYCYMVLKRWAFWLGMSEIAMHASSYVRTGVFSCIVGSVYVFCRRPAQLLSVRTVAVASAVSLSAYVGIFY